MIRLRVRMGIIWNGHFTLLLKDKDDKKKVSYEIQIFDDYILVRQNTYITKEL